MSVRLNVLENCNCIVEIFKRFFLKNKIETKDYCQFDQIVEENS